MSALRNYLNKIKPNFQKGGKLHAFESVFDGFESFLYVPNTTAKSGASIHDSIDSKRIMSFVVIALIPALLFGMYNVGYQNFKAAGTLDAASFIEVFGFGFLTVLPKLVVSYIVGLGMSLPGLSGSTRKSRGLPRQRYHHPIDHSCLYTAVDARPGVRLCSHLLQGNLRWHGYEHLQCGCGCPYVPLLLISIGYEW